MIDTNNEEQSQHPNYFSLLPLTALDDPSIPDGAKLLLARITSLANNEGRSWAQNAYFAKKHNTSERTIGTWIQRLKEEGYIKILHEYYPNSKKVKRRYIYPVIDPAAKRKAAGTKPDLVVKYTSPPDDLVVKNSSPPSGEVNFRDNNISLNNIKAAAAIHDEQNFEEPEKPPEKAAATAIFDEEELNKLQIHFKQLNPKLLFDEDFYPKVLAYLNYHEAGLNFVLWLYEACAKKNPRNIVNYFYTVFFEKCYVEMYREVTKPPPVILIRCPVCNTEHVKNETCPECGIEKDNIHNQAEVFRRKRLYTMTAAEKKAFETESEAILSGTWDIQKSRDLDSLHRRYGLVQDG